MGKGGAGSVSILWPLSWGAQIGGPGERHRYLVPERAAGMGVCQAKVYLDEHPSVAEGGSAFSLFPP